MTKRPLFKLSPRLKACADFVTPGSRIADIGTDHAYLPIWLAKSGYIKSAIASDLREGPIENAKLNIEKYRVSDKVETRLSNGLLNIRSDEIDEVIIAGIGGDLIIKIISDSPWLKTKKLILQPMTAAYELRCFLFNESYLVVDEKAIEDSGKVYTVMYINPEYKKPVYNEIYPYIGLILNNWNNDTKKYIEKEITHLKKMLNGATACCNYEEASLLKNIIAKLEFYVKRDC